MGGGGGDHLGLFDQFRGECHLIGQVQHAQVGLYFEAKGGEAGHTILWPGELMEDDGVFRVQLLLLPAQRKDGDSSVLFFRLACLRGDLAIILHKKT